jgi:hypothetical protein
MGPMGEKWRDLPDIATVPRLCVVGLIALLLIAGVFPQAVLYYIVPSLMWP